MKLESLWHLRGRVDIVVQLSGEDILDRVVKFLRNQRKPISGRDIHSITFDAPIFQPNPGLTSFDALVGYERGRIWIDNDLQPTTIYYDLRSLNSFIYLCLSTLLAFFIFLRGSGLIAAFMSSIVLVTLYVIGKAFSARRVRRLIIEMISLD
jgi:hypothetical protein